MKNKIAKHLIVKPPLWARKLYPQAIWSIPSTQKKIYLSFDDGPQPDITDFVLDQLQEYNAKASFFCIGKNINAHPLIFQRILSDGHSTGNHTQLHLNGWKTKNDDYFRDIADCEKVLQHQSVGNKKLFRPPYGKVLHSQYRKLSQDFQLVFWDVLSMDYDPAVSSQEIVSNVIDNATTGSIVVFHDSVKASKNLRIVLPEILKFYNEKGYTFERL